MGEIRQFWSDDREKKKIATHLLEGSKSSIGGLSRLLKGVEESGDGLVDGTSSDNLLSDVERLSSSRANGGVRIDERSSDDLDDCTLVRLQRGLCRVGHDLGEGEADSLALATVGRRHSLLKDGDDLSEDSFSELARRIGEGPGRGL